MKNVSLQNPVDKSSHITVKPCIFENKIKDMQHRDIYKGFFFCGGGIPLT